MGNTIIFLTDNSLPEPLASRVKEILVKESGGVPIVSVSQKPIDLGLNVCVGEIGRSWLSLYKQMYEGVKEAITPFVCIVEHDCLYSSEHLNWTPHTNDTFYYNHNCWFVQWDSRRPEIRGMYSYWKRRYALSQLICSRELLKKSLEERLGLLNQGYLITKGLRGAGEFGVADQEAIEHPLQAAYRRANSGRSVELVQLDKYLTPQKAEAFMTELPNIDIRHDNNFTGMRRGKNRCYELPYWGRFEKLTEGMMA